MRKTILRRTTIAIVAVLLLVVVLLGVVRNTVISHPEVHEIQEEHAHSKGDKS